MHKKKKSRHVRLTTVVRPHKIGDWLGKQGTNKVNNEKTLRGSEWILEKHGSWKILAQSRHLGSI